MKDDSFDCTLIAHLRIFLLFYRLLYCLILPENRLFFGIWKVVEIEYEEYGRTMYMWYYNDLESNKRGDCLSYSVDVPE